MIINATKTVNHIFPRLNSELLPVHALQPRLQFYFLVLASEQSGAFFVFSCIIYTIYYFYSIDLTLLFNLNL
jgi:hypothetical protein